MLVQWFLSSRAIRKAQLATCLLWHIPTPPAVAMSSVSDSAAAHWIAREASVFEVKSSFLDYHLVAHQSTCGVLPVAQCSQGLPAIRMTSHRVDDCELFIRALSHAKPSPSLPTPSPSAYFPSPLPLPSVASIAGGETSYHSYVEARLATLLDARPRAASTVLPVAATMFDQPSPTTPSLEANATIANRCTPSRPESPKAEVQEIDTDNSYEDEFEAETESVFRSSEQVSPRETTPIIYELQLPPYGLAHPEISLLPSVANCNTDSSTSDDDDDDEFETKLVQVPTN